MTRLGDGVWDVWISQVSEMMKSPDVGEDDVEKSSTMSIKAPESKVLSKHGCKQRCKAKKKCSGSC